MSRARPAPRVGARARGGGFARVVVAALVLDALVGCRGRARPASADAGGAPEPPAPAPIASVAPSGSATAPAPHAAAAARPAPHPLDVALASAPLVGLTLHARPGRGPVEARLAFAPGAPALRVDLALAEVDAPRAHDRPLAFHALGRALGLSVVGPAALRRLGLDELGRALGAAPEALEVLRRAAVQNDGTVDALLVAWPAAGRVVSADASLEAVKALRAAASEAPGPGEDTRLVGAFVELVALDYLAGNGVRRTVVLDEPAGAIVAVDGVGAFPLWVDPVVTDRLLGRLRAFRRFPRALRDALARFDRAAARAALAPGPFEGWLVSPRTLVELDERRLALLSLLEARVSALGEARVLSL